MSMNVKFFHFKKKFYSMSTIRLSAIIIFVFIFSSSVNVYSGELRIGSEHQGSLKGLYAQKINLVLPEGTWKVDENKETEFSELSYQDITLERVDGEYGWLYIMLPTSKTTGGMRWSGGGLKKCDGIPSKDVIASGVERGGVEATLCLSKYSSDGYDDINLYMEVAITNGPMSYMYYDYYGDYKSFNFDLDKNKKKDLIKDVIKGIKSGMQGGDPSLMTSMNSFFK